MRRIARQSEQWHRYAQEYPVIHPEDLSTPDARRSRPVSHEEFQQLAAQGHQKYNELASQHQDTSALDNNWDATVKHAYEQTRQPWGGATYNANTAKPLQGNEDLYAITAKDPGKQSVEVEPHASYSEFHRAMTNARTQFAPELSRPGHHLGVFHDDDVKKIQFDPSFVTPHHSDVESLGAYTQNVGGAYHFKSGDGFWPPHVPSTPQPNNPKLV